MEDKVGPLSGNRGVGLLNNIPVTQSDADAVKTYVRARRSFMMGELAKVTAPFVITNNNGINFTTSSANILLGGKAPVEVANIRINSTTSNAPVTWNTIANWTITVPLNTGSNLFTVRGYHRLNVSNAVAIITITKSP